MAHARTVSQTSYTVQVPRSRTVNVLHCGCVRRSYATCRDGSCGGAMQCKISQSGRMELQDVVGLPFDIFVARIKPFTWEEFFARIPIQEQKETHFAYDAHQLQIEGYLPRGVGVTIHKMLEKHSFGHLIAENTKGVLRMSPVFCVVLCDHCQFFPTKVWQMILVQMNRLQFR
jgi:hypothetical protein